MLGEPVAAIPPFLGMPREIEGVTERRGSIAAFRHGSEIEDRERNHGCRCMRPAASAPVFTCGVEAYSGRPARQGLSLYPVLKIQATIAMQTARKNSVAARLIQTLTSARP